MEQPEEMERMGREATAIEQQYTWANYHRRIIQIVEEIAMN